MRPTCPAEVPCVFPSGPVALPGQRIGLLGGSFDPPHAGHVHISRWALKAFRLDRVWWLVSPGNPLKADAPADMARRLAAAREIVNAPPDRGDRPRGAARNALHRRDAGDIAGAVSRHSLRLADGRRQSRRVPSLGALGGDYGARSGRRSGAAGRAVARGALAGGAALCALAAADVTGRAAGARRSARAGR